MRTKYLVSGIAITLAGLFFWAVWPTMYKYKYAELDTYRGTTKILIRINRFTNGTEALFTFDGWKKLQREPSSFSDQIEQTESYEQAPMSSAEPPSPE